MEKYLVGTFIGQGLLRLSDIISLRLISIHNPEMASMIANQILVDKLVTRLCPKGGTFVDVGAHIGSIFTTVHRNNPTATIIAVEADPNKAKDLSARFSYCDMRWAAAGEQSGTVELYVNPKATGYNSIVAGASAGAQAVVVPLKHRLEIRDRARKILNIQVTK